MKGPLFYSKILLFGEYGIIKDSKGLSIPYNFYKGALKVDANPDEVAVKSNQSLGRFATYLQELQETQPELVQFDIEALQADVAKGMYFDSTIPQGYGVGSSGALLTKSRFLKISLERNCLSLKKSLGRWSHSSTENLPV